jgi:glycerol kinase
MEQDAEELLYSVFESAHLALSFFKREGLELMGTGLSFQRSGVLAWDNKTGSALTPLYSWRYKGFLDQSYKPTGNIRELVLEKTTLPFLPNYAATKISYLQQEFSISDLHKIGTLDSFIINRLSKEKFFITEDGMASRSMLYSLKNRCWDQELCKLLKVDVARLPEIAPSIFNKDITTTIPGLSVSASVADANAALLGSLAPKLQVVLNFGGISSLCIFTGEQLKKSTGMLSSAFFSSGDKTDKRMSFLLESVTPTSHSVIDFICKDLKVPQEEISKIAFEAQSSGIDQGVFAFLFFNGSGSPYWKESPSFSLGWKSASRAAKVRAALESLGGFISNSLLMLASERLLRRDKQRILVSGGISNCDYLLQFIADVTGFELIRKKEQHSSARGAAIAAMISKGAATFPLSLNLPTSVEIFSPKNSPSLERFKAWKVISDDILHDRLLAHQIERIN